MTKPIAAGVFTRSYLPSAGTPVRVATANVNWSSLEATRDVYTLGPIESLLDTAEARGLAGVRLRVMLGRYSPDWAKAIGDGPVTYTHTYGGVETGTIPDLWDPNWQAEAAELFGRIAATYDTDPRLRLIFATGAMTWYGEPLLRGVSYEPNRTNLLAAGYTRAADEALQRAQLDWLKGFRSTPVGLAYNPLQFIRADGSSGSDLTFVASLMDHHLATFGPRTVLQNNSIRSSYIDAVPPLYRLFLDRLSAPGTTSYQTAAAARVGDADATMRWAIDYLNASGVELVDGYPSVHTDSELSTFDTALAANDPGGPPTPSATHSVSWTTSGNGTLSEPSCVPGELGVTTCAVRYLPAPGSAGDHTITAIYSGSATSPGPASTLLPVRPRESATTLTCSSPIPTGEKSRCSVTVSDGSGGEVIAPTGDVGIAVDGVDVGSCALATSSGSTAACELDVAATAGTYQVTAAYPGDADHTPSAAVPVPVTVDAPPAKEPPVEESPVEQPPVEEPPVEEPAGDTVAPVVRVMTPLDGATIAKAKRFTITAEASDDRGVTMVEFVVNGFVACSRTSGWTCATMAPKGAGKPVSITVTAWDEAGNTAVATVTVTTSAR